MLWRELESACGDVLLEEVGGVDRAAVEQFDSILGQHGVPHQVLAPEEGAERWSGMRFDGPILFQPGGGRLYADRTVAALQRLAASHGARIEQCHVVQSIRLTTAAGGAAVEIATDREVFRPGG